TSTLRRPGGEFAGQKSRMRHAGFQKAPDAVLKQDGNGEKTQEVGMSASEAKSTINVDDVQIPVRNLGKLLYPESGTTKGEVIDYLRAIAPVLLPQLAQRPVNGIRFPDGLDGQRFFEKSAP